jgi:hypothetical protein
MFFTDFIFFISKNTLSSSKITIFNIMKYFLFLAKMCSQQMEVQYTNNYEQDFSMIYHDKPCL